MTVDPARSPGGALRRTSQWPSGFAEQTPGPWPTYELADASLVGVGAPDDLVPSTDGEQRSAHLTNLMRDAVVYGLPAVHQYLHLHRLVLTQRPLAGFNELYHDRQLATPHYGAFKTPNVDTLYSNGWLDLTHGPVVVTAPPMRDRYYTLHFLDAWSNASNLSARTLGHDGGRVQVTHAGSPHLVRPDLPVFWVATPYAWLLVRIFVRDRDDLAAARSLQDAIHLSGKRAAPRPSAWPTAPDAPEDVDGITFLRLLDEVLRRNGRPREEAALTHRFRALGLGTERGVDGLHTGDQPAIDAGFAAGMTLIRSVVPSRGRTAGTSGWRILTSGEYGFNHLERAATNYVGLGATVRAESGAYTTFVDASGAVLSGESDRLLRLAPPPPVTAFWSVTAYDVATRELIPNDADRYSVSSQTPGLVTENDGAVTIRLTATAGREPAANTLPVPTGRYYLVLRAYHGDASVVDGTWSPPPVTQAPTTDTEEYE